MRVNDREIRVVYITNIDNKLELHDKTIKDTLNTFYSLLNCDTIDIIVRYIDGTPYNIIVDDEFLLKVGQEQDPTMFEILGRERLYGNVIITPINQEDESELGSFNDKEIVKLLMDLIRFNMTYMFNK